MAESSGEKTELPTPKKLRDARKKGQVCSSRDVVSTAILVVMMVVCALLVSSVYGDFDQLTEMIGRLAGRQAADAVRLVGCDAVVMVVFHSFVFVTVAAVVAIAANLCQIGFLFAAEPIKPNLTKLNPAEGFKRIFSAKNFFEFAKNCFKVTFLGYLIYRLVMASYEELLTLCYGEVAELLPVLASLMKRLAVYTAFGYVLIAVVDRLFQQKNFLRQMMMTKSEVKREYREMEGSPEIKNEQRRLRNEILFGPDLTVATRKSDVVVANPTHLAVGIRYRKEEAPLPKVTVKGSDREAALIRKVALEEGIPIMEDVPLARRLFAETNIEDFIPIGLVKPVAEVLKWVKRLNEAKREERELESVRFDTPGMFNVMK